MGFLDSILGRTSQTKPRIDQLFAISTATVTIETKLELKPAGKAAICFKPVESAKFSEVERDLKSLLEVSAKSTGTKFTILKDEYNYLWVLLEDKDFEDLVTAIHMISENLIESGFQDRILCAVFKFKGEKEKEIYWVYSYKQGKFYPFIPISDKEKQRDNAFEFRLKAELEKELPIEGELEKWYPLWGLPV